MGELMGGTVYMSEISTPPTSCVLVGLHKDTTELGTFAVLLRPWISTKKKKLTFREETWWGLSRTKHSSIRRRWNIDAAFNEVSQIVETCFTHLYKSQCVCFLYQLMCLTVLREQHISYIWATAFLCEQDKNRDAPLLSETSQNEIHACKTR